LPGAADLFDVEGFGHPAATALDVTLITDVPVAGATVHDDGAGEPLGARRIVEFAGVTRGEGFDLTEPIRGSLAWDLVHGVDPMLIRLSPLIG
jgi:hypothetical protein